MCQGMVDNAMNGKRTVDKRRVPGAKLDRLPLTEEPFQRVAVDFVGPLERPASDGWCYFLTTVYYATRYPSVNLNGELFHMK